MVKKPGKAPKAPKNQNRSVIPPASWTGYPVKKPCACPLTALGKTAGGGKGAS